MSGIYIRRVTFVILNNYSWVGTVFRIVDIMNTGDRKAGEREREREHAIESSRIRSEK